MSNAWEGTPSLVLGHDQYSMKRDHYKLALIEWRKAHPQQRREADLTNEDRQWILNRAEELSQGL